MFFWTRESIRLFKNAAEYNQYHEFLKGVLHPFIEKEDTVLDLGCGLGYLSLELAPICAKVTAMDVDSNALQVLSENIEEKTIRNIQVLYKDWKNIPPSEKWDIVVVCFFGQLRRDIEGFLKKCNKRVIAVVSNESASTFLPKAKNARHKEQAKDIQDFLSENYQVRHYEQTEVQFGQPFLSYDEAVSFVKHYRPKNDDASIQEHLEKYLVPANTKPYTYVLPNEKSVGIFVIEKS